MLVGRGHDAAFARPRVAEDDGADAHCGPFVFGERLAALDDKIWPETIHWHGFATSGLDAVVQFIKRCGAGDQNRGGIGKRDEIACHGSGFRHGTMKSTADAHQTAVQSEDVSEPCRDFVSTILGAQIAIAPNVYRHERRTRIASTRHGDAAVAVGGECECFFRQRRRNSRHGWNRPLREEFALSIDDEETAVADESESINLHRRDITAAERLDRVDVQAVDVHADAYARNGLMILRIFDAGESGIKALELETEGVVLDALAAEAGKSPEQTSLLADTDAALATVLEKLSTSMPRQPRCFLKHCHDIISKVWGNLCFLLELFAPVAATQTAPSGTSHTSESETSAPCTRASVLGAARAAVPSPKRPRRGRVTHD